MQIQSHVMSGWCLGNLFRLTPRERLFAMIAASAEDLDGLGIFFDGNYYSRFHHVLGHNVFYGALMAGVLAAFSYQRRKAFAVFLGLFHLHLAMDYLGSGPGWGISYLWPLSSWELYNPIAWNFFSWQNMTAAAALFVWCIGIWVWLKRTPLEVIYPSLNRSLVGLFRGKPTSSAAHQRSPILKGD